MRELYARASDSGLEVELNALWQRRRSLAFQAQEARERAADERKGCFRLGTPRQDLVQALAHGRECRARLHAATSEWFRRQSVRTDWDDLPDTEPA